MPISCDILNHGASDCQLQSTAPCAAPCSGSACEEIANLKEHGSKSEMGWDEAEGDCGVREDAGGRCGVSGCCGPTRGPGVDRWVGLGASSAACSVDGPRMRGAGGQGQHDNKAAPETDVIQRRAIPKAIEMREVKGEEAETRPVTDST